MVKSNFSFDGQMGIFDLASTGPDAALLQAGGINCFRWGAIFFKTLTGQKLQEWHSLATGVDPFLQRACADEGERWRPHHIRGKFYH